MIEPFRSGRALVAEIAATRPAERSVAVWWLGQSGFVLKSAAATVLIDAYLSEHLTHKYAGTAHPHDRMTRAPLLASDLTDVDLILCSHKHSDHMDPGSLPALLAASPEATLIVPASLKTYAAGLCPGVERIEGIEAFATFHRAGVSVRAVPSAHEGLDTDDQGRHLYLGFVVALGGLRFYHSGDGLAYVGLADAIGPEPLDVMFLPINGRDPARGVAGNMSAAEAVDLAAKVRPRFVVPHHYDMFTFNTAPVAEFEVEARRLPPETAPKVLACGQRWEVSR